MIRYKSQFTTGTVNPGRCFAKHSGLRPGDLMVFELGEIDLERGLVEIGQEAVEDMARMLGWVPNAQYEKMLEGYRAAEGVMEYYREKANGARIEVVADLSAKVASLEAQLEDFLGAAEEEGPPLPITSAAEFELNLEADELAL